MNYIPRLKEEYNNRVVKNLKETFSYKSIMQVPKLQKIVLSRGVGGAVADKKLIEVLSPDEFPGQNILSEIFVEILAKLM